MEPRDIRRSLHFKGKKPNVHPPEGLKPGNVWLADTPELRPSDSVSNVPDSEFIFTQNTSSSHAQDDKLRQRQPQSTNFRFEKLDTRTSPKGSQANVRTDKAMKTHQQALDSDLPRISRNGLSRKFDTNGPSAKPSGPPGDPPSPWNPEVTLIERPGAPLGSRVSLPPPALSMPDSLKPRTLKSLPLQEQENLILADLLFVLMGFEGEYIRFASSYHASEEKQRLQGPQFRLSTSLDPSLHDLAMTVLKTATHYIAMESFVEVQSREDFGMVNHALCASIRKLLRDYLVLVAQMENQLLTNENFTLHQLRLYLLPTAQNLAQLYALGQEILKKNNVLDGEAASDEEEDIEKIIEQLKEGNDFEVGTRNRAQKGGRILRLLSERSSLLSGDPAARELLDGLLRDASRPYMHMLNEWLHRGVIKDPHGEFMIKQHERINRENLEEDYTDEYWDKRYTIRDHDIPPQLEPVKAKVLLAGKYLNVVRECGGVEVGKEIQDIPRTFHDPRFLNNVNEAYAYANSSLLNLLLTTHELPARLRSLKHYFFLDRSDFFSYFLYLSNSELRKQVKEINIGKLQSLLDLVLHQHGSVAMEDPFKEDIKVHMNDKNLLQFLMSVVNVRGFEDGAEQSLPQRTPVFATQESDEDRKRVGYQALEFKFAVPFPLSLVISSKTVVRYQIIFRYLLNMRHLESQLVHCWEDQVKVVSWIHRSTEHKLEHWKRRAWMLRARMLNFVQSFLYYCTMEVIEPNWQSLMMRVNGTNKDGQSVSRTVDELMNDHVDFLDTVLKECMLMNPKLLKIHEKICLCCTSFAAYGNQLCKGLLTADASLAGKPAANKYLESLYPSPRHPAPDGYKLYDPETFPKVNEMLAKFEDNFNRHIKILLDALDYYAATETVALSRLCAQLSTASEKGAWSEKP